MLAKDLFMKRVSHIQRSVVIRDNNVNQRLVLAHPIDLPHSEEQVIDMLKGMARH